MLHRRFSPARALFNSRPQNPVSRFVQETRGTFGRLRSRCYEKDSVANWMVQAFVLRNGEVGLRMNPSADQSPWERETRSEIAVVHLRVPEPPMAISEEQGMMVSFGIRPVFVWPGRSRISPAELVVNPWKGCSSPCYLDSERGWNRMKRRNGGPLPTAAIRSSRVSRFSAVRTTTPKVNDPWCPPLVMLVSAQLPRRRNRNVSIFFPLALVFAQRGRRTRAKDPSICNRQPSFTELHLVRKLGQGSREPRILPRTRSASLVCHGARLALEPPRRAFDARCAPAVTGRFVHCRGELGPRVRRRRRLALPGFLVSPFPTTLRGQRCDPGSRTTVTQLSAKKQYRNGTA